MLRTRSLSASSTSSIDSTSSTSSSLDAGDLASFEAEIVASLKTCPSQFTPPGPVSSTANPLASKSKISAARSTLNAPVAEDSVVGAIFKRPFLTSLGSCLIRYCLELLPFGDVSRIARVSVELARLSQAVSRHRARKTLTSSLSLPYADGGSTCGIGNSRGGYSDGVRSGRNDTSSRRKDGCGLGSLSADRALHVGAAVAAAAAAPPHKRSRALPQTYAVLAQEVEEVLFNKCGRQVKRSYTRQLRRLTFALRSNHSLRERVQSHRLSPQALAASSTEALANNDLNQRRAALRRKGMEDVIVPASWRIPGAMPSDHFTCSRCQSRQTSYRFFATAGSLRHDPFGARKIYVSCVMCGHGWEHQGLLPS